MTNRDKYNAVMHCSRPEGVPAVHCGYSRELLNKWAAAGYISVADAQGWKNSNDICCCLSARLGFDYNFNTFYSPVSGLMPEFQESVTAVFADGSRQMRNRFGQVINDSPGTDKPPEIVRYLLDSREAWKTHFLPKLQWSMARISPSLAFDAAVFNATSTHPPALGLGSIFALPLEIMGVKNVKAAATDDPQLLQEIFSTFADVVLENTRTLLDAGFRPDCAFLKEEITPASASVLTPEFFAVYIAPAFRRLQKLLARNGCPITAVNCGQYGENSIPLWAECGAELFFPVSVEQMLRLRQQYGSRLRGIGGIDPAIFTADRKTVDIAVAALQPLLGSGGFIPCPRGELPPETKWELVQYYTEQIKKCS